MSDILNNLKEIDWAISLLAAIPLAIISNLITPKVADFISSFSMNRKRKRIEKIIKEREEIIKLVGSPEKITIEVAINIFKFLLIFSFANLIAIIPYSAYRCNIFHVGF